MLKTGNNKELFLFNKSTLQYVKDFDIQCYIETLTIDVMVEMIVFTNKKT